MTIVIEVASYYDWDKMSPDEAAAMSADRLAAEMLALRVKQGADGGLLRKVLVEESSHVEVQFPEAMIADQIAHHERVGAPKTRAQVVAGFVAEKTLQHHAHPDHVTSVSIEGEPETEALLAAYFGVGGK